VNTQTPVPPGPRTTRRIAATAAVLGLAALMAPAGASASNGNVDGVHAAIKQGVLKVKGGPQATAVALRLLAKDPSLVEVDVGDDGSADFSFARNVISAIDVAMGRGDDSTRIDDSNGVFTDAIPTMIAGGGGDDSLNGGAGAETFVGGRGDDRVVGGKGADAAALDAGDDTFVWAPGDANDSIDGQRGADTMLFIGADANEEITMTANADRLKFFRDVANVTMDTDGVETVDFKALGGTDKITVNDLTGTDVTQVDLDLAGTSDPGAGDGAVDNVVVNGTDGDDTITIEGSRSGVDVAGLATAVSVSHPDPTDVLSVNTLAGTDNVFTSGVAGALQVLVDGAAV
jgi:Ca2+-binding RTX toxin-like protein